MTVDRLLSEINIEVIFSDDSRQVQQYMYENLLSPRMLEVYYTKFLDLIIALTLIETTANQRR